LVTLRYRAGEISSARSSGAIWSTAEGSRTRGSAIGAHRRAVGTEAMIAATANTPDVIWVDYAARWPARSFALRARGLDLVSDSGGVSGRRVRMSIGSGAFLLEWSMKKRLMIRSSSEWNAMTTI